MTMVHITYAVLHFYMGSYKGFYIMLRVENNQFSF